MTARRRLRIRPLAAALPLAVAAILGGCVENTAPGNDREAHLDPPSRAADLVSVEEATGAVEPGLLFPEVMTDADRASLPARGGRCAFRFTRVGLPVFTYGPEGGVIKLNGKLVALPAGGAGRYSAGGVMVTVRPLQDREEGTFPAELVLRIARSPNELGFHGYGEC